MKSKTLFRLLLILAAGGFSAVAVRAEDLGAIRARIGQRVEAVVQLKARHVAGENNRGYLEARGGGATGADQKIISDENSDRRAVYAAIAAETKTSAEEVGRKRAMKLNVDAKRGEWVQDAGGEWRQKG